MLFWVGAVTLFCTLTHQGVRMNLFFQFWQKKMPKSEKVDFNQQTNTEHQFADKNTQQQSETFSGTRMASFQIALNKIPN